MKLLYRYLPVLLLPGLFCSTSALWAGQAEVKAPVETLIEPATPENPWELTFRPYGWAAGVNGTTGIAGYTAETDVSFKNILDGLEMVAMMQVDVRYDQWLLLLDGQYLQLGADAQPSDGILSSASLEITQVMLEAAIGYRVWAGDAGYLDVFAGARYMSVEGEITLQLNERGVTEASEKLSREIVDRVRDTIRSETAPALRAAQSAAQQRVFELRSNTRSKIEAEVRQRIRDRLEQIIQRPEIGRDVVDRGPVRDAIRDLISAKVDEAQAEIDAARASASAKIQQAKARARARAKRAVDKAERKLAESLEAEIYRAVPEKASGKEEWVDPIIGLRGRYDFAGPLYIAGRADIGGFGVGSDFSWQVYGALGCQVTRSATVELGYRHMAVDYTSGGFVYDVATSGAVLATGITF